MMRTTFIGLAEQLQTLLSAGEVFTAWFQGETSDFVRFNRGRVRQPGNVRQQSLTVDLIRGERHAAGTVTISGDPALDGERLVLLVRRLRDALPHIPDDPFLSYNTSVKSSERIMDDRLPDAAEVALSVLEHAGRYDFVGIYAGGRVYRGFASSLGQRNWFERASFHLDFSLFYRGDKAVKGAYAGDHWQDDAFAARIGRAAAELRILEGAPKTIEPGAYRVYLAPAAVSEILSVLAWGGFGLKSHRTKQTPLLKMITEGARLHQSFTLSEHTAASTGPSFGAAGFVKPDRVDLIRNGVYEDALCSPRSAKEYGVETNGARDDETPTALDLAGGDLASADLLERLGTGIYVNNLWYLNYSDRAAGRITGMTRFATLWVEGGRVVAPLNVMRFDETVYRVFGQRLLGLTRERDFILDNDTYGQRSTGCAWVPGALVDEMRFTL